MTTSTETASAITTALETLLADSYALMAQTHLAHWNVEGTDFFQLHTAFQGQYEELFSAIDDIAEHLRTLEAYAPGGLTMLAGLSKIGQMERKLPAKDYVANLIDYHELLVANAKEGRQISGDAGDTETEDLFIERLRVHQKTLWMLKSHLK
ncbi:MAG: DNA starvation/stationary phase protection protein [Verrucomicrobiota bacterium]